MLGRKDAAWGYHGDDGRLFGGELSTRGGTPYGPTFSEGDTVGCGVNFDTGTAFYTKNGEIIGQCCPFFWYNLPSLHWKLTLNPGQAFTNIIGKLYPAVSMDLKMEGLKITARFPDDSDSLDSFRFQGSRKDPKTFEETDEAVMAAKQAADDREALEREMGDGSVREQDLSSTEDDDSIVYSSENEEYSE